MTSDEIILAVAGCEDAMSSLPADVRDAISEIRRAHEKWKIKMARLAAAQESRDKERQKEMEEKEAKDRAHYLCLGEWGEKVPLDRRFALCRMKMGQRNLHCAIDLVLGNKGPYWDYFGDSVYRYYKERIKKVLDAAQQDALNHEDQLWKVIRKEFDFNMRDDEMVEKFQVLHYQAEEPGFVKIVGASEPKTWAEHQADLKAEFDK